MAGILLRLSNIENINGGRPQQCPYCGGQFLQRWGSAVRKIQDLQAHTIPIYRYRCFSCKRSFRLYPKELDRAAKTLRIRRLAGLAWLMGLSYREVTAFLKSHGIRISRSTVWRYCKVLAQSQIDQGLLPSWRKYSIDTEYNEGHSHKLGLVIAVDLGDGKPVILGAIDENNPKAILHWLQPLADIAGIEVLQLTPEALFG